VFRRALPRTKKGILRSSRSASSAQPARKHGAQPGGRQRAGGLLRRTLLATAGVRRCRAVTGSGSCRGCAASTLAEPRCEGRAPIVELEVLAEHRQQVLLQAHHQRMHPGVEEHVRALEAHLRR
jgi:hypothetical protein